MAPPRRPVPRGRGRGRPGRTLGAIGLRPVLERLRSRHRRRRWQGRRRPRRRHRPRQPRSARTEGSLRLASDQRARPAHDPARTPRREPRATDVGRRSRSARRAHQGPARKPRPRRDRLLQLRPAGPRGLLRADDARARRHQHAPPRRQHPAVHGDRRRGAEGDVRRRRRPGVVHRRRPLRHAAPRRPQRRRDADRAVVADARSAGRRRSPCARGHRPPAHRARAPRRRPPPPAAGHQPGAAQRARQRADPHGRRADRLRRCPHDRVCDARRDRRRVHARMGRRGVRRGRRRHPVRGGDPRPCRCLVVDRPARRLPVAPGHRRRPARSTTSTCCWG